MNPRDYSTELEELLILLAEISPNVSFISTDPKPSFIMYGGWIQTVQIAPHKLFYHFRVSEKGVWSVSRKTLKPTICVEWIGDAALGELHKIMIPEMRGLCK